MSLVNSQAVLVIATIAVALLLATLLFRLLKASLGLTLAVLAIVLVVYVGFGITPGQIWAEIGNLPRDVTQLAQSFDPSTLTSLFAD